MKKLSLAKVVCLFALSAVASGCIEVKSTTTSTPATSNSATSADKSVLVSKLQQADQLDGKEDHVIGKCYVCGLGMDGKADHSAEFEGYTAHLCSDMCCKHFKENAEKVITETDVPKTAAK
ncbi:MAG: hypothetical protein U0930_02875 [Pirellulales bacterium]